MLPDMAESMSSSVGLGFDESNDTACMIWPGWQYPHCGTFTSAQAFCTGCGPLAEIDSMVVISRPSTVPIGLEQERMAFPFCNTVQAPHSAMPQPNFVPVSPRMSRRYHSSGISGSPSKVLGASVHLEMNHGALPGIWVGRLPEYCTAGRVWKSNLDSASGH